MAKAFIDDTNLTAIADAIRAQNGSTNTYLPNQMAEAIEALPVLDTSDATTTAEDMVNGVTGYARGSKIAGTMQHLNTEDHFIVDSSSFNGANNFAGETLYIESNKCSNRPTSRVYLEPTDNMTFEVDGSYLGDAGENDVVSGKTFTSISGLKKEGTLVIQKYYTGTEDPDDSIGNDGDLYLKVSE